MRRILALTVLLSLLLPLPAIAHQQLLSASPPEGASLDVRFGLAVGGGLRGPFLSGHRVALDPVQLDHAGSLPDTRRVHQKDRIAVQIQPDHVDGRFLRAVAQAGSMEERMELFLDSMEDATRSGTAATTREDLVTDDEIDRMINAEVLASEKAELSKLDDLESQIAKELGAVKQKD